MHTVHRNGRHRAPLEIASLAEIETEVADVLDVMERVAGQAGPNPRAQLDDPLFQVSEAIHRLAWCIASLAKHYENHVVDGAAK